MPPLRVLHAMVREGIFVSGVPIPDRSHAASVADELVRSGVISAEIAQQLASPPTGQSQAQQDFLQRLGRDGHARRDGDRRQINRQTGRRRRGNLHGR